MFVLFLLCFLFKMSNGSLYNRVVCVEGFIRGVSALRLASSAPSCQLHIALPSAFYKAKVTWFLMNSWSDIIANLV